MALDSFILPIIIDKMESHFTLKPIIFYENKIQFLHINKNLK